MRDRRQGGHWGGGGRRGEGRPRSGRRGFESSGPAWAPPPDRELIYGRQPVAEMLRAGRRKFNHLFISETIQHSAETDFILQLAQSRGVAPEFLPPRDLDDRCGDVNHQGVAADASLYEYVDIGEILAAKPAGGLPPLILLLDHIQDPQNVGAVMRVAEGVGALGVVIPVDRACGVTPAVVRASAGAAEHVRVTVVTNLVQTMELLKTKEFWIAGLESVPEAKLHTETDLSGPLGLVVGGEGSGLKRLARERCDFLIRLPMLGRVASLNVGTATAVAAYEIRRQQSIRAAAAGSSASGSSE